MRFFGFTFAKPFLVAGLQMRERKCGWITSPPMVCAHGGDSTNAFPNSVGFQGRRMRDPCEFDFVSLTNGFPHPCFLS